jgi:hypothetical protein
LNHKQADDPVTVLKATLEEKIKEASEAGETVIE